MRRITGNTNYFDFKNVNKGDVLVDGHYLGEIDGTYGVQHEFKSLAGDLTVIGGKHLDFLVSKYLKPGDRCRVLFEGFDTVQKGKFTGKPVKKFSLDIEDGDKAPTHPAPVAKAKESTVAPWDNLEPAHKPSNTLEALTDDMLVEGL